MDFDRNSLTLTDQQTEIVRDLAEVRSAIAELRAREKPLRDALLGILQDADAAVALTAAGSQVAHLETQVRLNVNRDHLEAMFPDVWEKVTSEKEIIVVKLG